MTVSGEVILIVVVAALVGVALLFKHEMDELWETLSAVTEMFNDVNEKLEDLNRRVDNLYAEKGGR